jgi:hypothetical protein
VVVVYFHRMSLELAAGVTDQLGSVEDLVALWESNEQTQAGKALGLQLKKSLEGKSTPGTPRNVIPVSARAPQAASRIRQPYVGAWQNVRRYAPGSAPRR